MTQARRKVHSVTEPIPISPLPRENRRKSTIKKRRGGDGDDGGVA